MLSLRLPPELQSQLEHLSSSTGIPKNTILVKALAEHLKTIELGEIPLEEPVTEHAFNDYVRRREEHAERYKNAHVIAEWSNRNVIFTKNPSKTGGTGELTPGSYGRNVVVGFCDGFYRDENLYVISRHISYPSYGTAALRLDITRYEDWIEYMKAVEPRRA